MEGLIFGSEYADAALTFASSSTSATLILWGVLLLAMVALLGLTLRLLRKPPEG